MGYTVFGLVNNQVAFSDTNVELTGQFVNAAGATIIIKDIHSTANGEVCEFPEVMDGPMTPVATHDLYRRCFADQTCPTLTCDILGGGGSCIADGTFVTVPNDEQFSVMLSSLDTTPIGPCAFIEDSEIYEWDIDITYEIELGGVIAEKHSVGTIRLEAVGR